MNTQFNHGAVHEFLVTFAGAGGTEADLAKLTKSKKRCGQVIQLLDGSHQLQPRPLVIDPATDPYCPEGWKVEEHIQTKPRKFNAKAIELYLDPAQAGGSILGHDLRKALKGKPVLNANALDWLLKEENQHLIPEEWKGKSVFFWGTIYRDFDGNLNVRYLNWNDGQWHWYWYWLDNRWNEQNPAALLASPL